MATQAQILANRANAQKSTGPKTAEGKARSSRNAEKHGLTARSTVIGNEAEDEVADILASYEDLFQPQTALESDLVRQLAVTQWRLGRAAYLEMSLLRRSISDASERWSEECEGDPFDDDNLPFVVGSALQEEAREQDSFSKLSRHELRLNHRYNRILTRLTWLQAKRNESTSTK